jgi:hypothetical protein
MSHIEWAYVQVMENIRKNVFNGFGKKVYLFFEPGRWKS